MNAGAVRCARIRRVCAGEDRHPRRFQLANRRLRIDDVLARPCVFRKSALQTADLIGGEIWLYMRVWDERSAAGGAGRALDDGQSRNDKCAMRGDELPEPRVWRTVAED